MLISHATALKKFLGKIVFIATPHYGSPIIAYYLREHIRGTWMMWTLGKYLEPETFRSLWGVMNLLPAPTGIYPGSRGNESKHPCLNFDCYRAEAWRLDLSSTASSRFQLALDDAATLHRELYDSHSTLDEDLLRSMLMIVGVGYSLPFRVEVQPGIVSGWRTVATFDRSIGTQNYEGDGSVPVASACLESVETRYVKGEHAALPNIPAVYDDVFRFLADKPRLLSTKADGALGGHLGPIASNSTIGFVDQSSATDPRFTTANRWSIPEPSPEDFEQIERQLRAGQLPDFQFTRIM